MSVFEQLGALALASRLKQLSENLSKDVAGVYQAMDISFEPRWFTLFWVLNERQSLTITELARELRQTHAAIVQLANLLEKKKLLLSKKDKNDERRRQLSLSAKGKELFEEVLPVLGAIEQANQELLQQSGGDFLNSLSELEQALEQKNMYARILDQLQQSGRGVVVRDYGPAYAEAFYSLNAAWILEHFGALEPADEQTLRKPEKEIIGRGGAVFVALHQKEAVGTVAVYPQKEGSCLLSKFAVQQEYRCKGVGTLLLEKAKAFAIAKGATSLLLFTSPVLVDSVNFYTRKGFIFQPITSQEKAQFKRETIKMQLSLPQG